MSLLFYKPPPPLDHYIECLWAIQQHIPYTREKILPTGTLELIFNFDAPHRLYDTENHFRHMRDVWISGLQTRYLINQPEGFSHMLGVRFRPQGLTAFVDFPVCELNNQVVDADLIWGRWIRDVHLHLAEQPSLQDQFDLLTHYLLSKRREQPTGWDMVNYAVQQLRKPTFAPSIRALSDEIGISHKHLITCFRQMVGLSPKALARVYKFQQVLYRIDPRQQPDWTTLAQHCHYYDQAHFNKEFQSFCGLTPTQYMQLRADYLATQEPGEAVHFVPIIG